jgi:hypothetical protein
MRLGIVGSEASKFTLETEMEARRAIASIIETYNADTVISGACHLGGIDIWAREEGHAVGCKVVEFPPKAYNWSRGYRPRNVKIAEESDVVVCITVKELPPEYSGMRFDMCYHCRTQDHVKSGGCWTVKYAREKLGKPGEIIVI